MENSGNNGSQQPQGDQLSCIINHHSVDGIIVNPNCKLCNSIHRKEAERMAEEARGNVSFSAIKAFLESKGESIALANVKNHIQKHFLGQSEKIALEEYRQNIVALSRYRAERFEAIAQLIDIATFEMTRCCVMPVNGMSDEKDRMKMLHDNMRIIMENSATLEDMEDGDKKIRVIHERVRLAFAKALEKAETDSAKRTLGEVVNNFNAAYGSLDGKSGG
jgi:hypothetical protein